MATKQTIIDKEFKKFCDDIYALVVKFISGSPDAQVDPSIKEFGHILQHFDNADYDERVEMTLAGFGNMVASLIVPHPNGPPMLEGFMTHTVHCCREFQKIVDKDAEATRQ